MAGESFIIRNYLPDDFDKHLQLRVESEQLDPSGCFISARNLSDNLRRPNFAPQKDLFVAESNAKLVGYLSVSLEPGIQRALLDGLVHPRHRRKGIATKLFSSSMQRVKAAGVKAAQISVLENNTAAKNLLTKLEFQFIRNFYAMKLDIHNARLPAVKRNSISSRRLKQTEENLLTKIQNRCFADTWGFNPNTTEEISYRLNMHGRSPDDVILTFLEDRLAGYCWTLINAEENPKRAKKKGLIHMLGVDPDYRNQEIGKAILLNGLDDLKGKGVDIVELTVDSQNPAACSLYESVGFKVYAKTEWYEKAVV
ncbi:MAG: GNAT family N-acetyltransferase [Desulfobacterales bacterium]|jgi:mycothiol synthase